MGTFTDFLHFIIDFLEQEDGSSVSVDTARMYIYPTPPQRAGCEKGQFLKWSKVGLNLVLFFID